MNQTEDDKNFIRSNIPALLLAPKVKSKTGEIAGEWKLLNDEIPHCHSTSKNIEFTVFLLNGDRWIKVTAKINRDTAKFSNIETWTSNEL
jgi:hypothetical protein